jgi:hypothetical protein
MVVNSWWIPRTGWVASSAKFQRRVPMSVINRFQMEGIMCCYVIDVHGRNVAYKKLHGCHFVNSFEEPETTGPYSQYGLKFREAFQTHVSLKTPDWTGVDKVTVLHLAEPDQEAAFEKAFSERALRSETVEDFIFWVIPPEVDDLTRVRLPSGRAATRNA